MLLQNIDVSLQIYPTLPFTPAHTNTIIGTIVMGFRAPL